MDYEKARKEIKAYIKTKQFKDFVKSIEMQIGRNLSRVEKELIAIDCMQCIELNTGKLDELKKYRIEVSV